MARSHALRLLLRPHTYPALGGASAGGATEVLPGIAPGRPASATGPASAARRTLAGARGATLATLAAAGFFAVSVVVLAWPISRHPATLVADFTASTRPIARWTALDRDLAAWVLGWTARAAVERPLDVFQGNIFHPAPDALASSENLLGLLPVSAPVFLATGNPVLTHNVTVLALVWALALATFVAVRGFTGSAAAGLLAGVCAAFAPIVVADWSNVISGTAVHLVPLVLLLAWRAAAAPRASLLVALAATVALQVLAGLYVAYQLLVVLAACAPGLWLEARRGGRSPWPVAVALGAGFLVLVPLGAPYLRVRASGVLPDPATARALAASLAPSWADAWQTLRDNLGWPGLLLAVVGLESAGVPLRVRASLLAAAALTFVLSGGPDVPLLPGTSLPGPYEIATRIVPGFGAMRAPGRFLIPTVLLLAMLAGLGAAAAARRLAEHGGRLRRQAASAAVVTLALLLVLARAVEPALPAKALPASPEQWNVYGWLRDHGRDGALVELPAMVSPLDARDLDATGEYLLGAAIHGLPLLNGYSGHAPASAELILTLAQRLPDARALAALCALTELRWIAVHLDTAPELRAAWRAAEAVLPVERVPGYFGPVWLYRVTASCGARTDALRAQLAGGGRGASLDGAPLAPLDARARRGHVTAEVTPLLAGLHAWLSADVRNDGDRVWPGATLDVPGAVLLQARLRDRVTGAAKMLAVPVPLGVDLAPGESVRVRVGVQAEEPGDYVIEVGLVQSGVGWFADQAGGGAALRAPVTVVPVTALARAERITPP